MGKELVRSKMIEIVTMQPEHVPAVALLEQECFSAPWSANSISREIGNPLSLWLVALSQGQVVAYVGSQTVLGEADMMNIAVATSHRRCGIAQSLVEALVAQLREKEAYQLTLEVRASNDAAVALYEKLGFAQVGRRPNYYTKPKEDALILRKEWSL